MARRMVQQLPTAEAARRVQSVAVDSGSATDGMPSLLERAAPITAFRFDAIQHTYTDLATRALIPHVTQLLERAGLVDETWLTEASAERGQLVHAMTSDFDLGSLDPECCVSKHRGYLLGHVACMARLRAVWQHIEVPLVHPTLRFAGRPDRIGTVLRRRCVFEIKSGAPMRAHGVQLALQAILAAGALGDPLPPEQWARYCEYLKPSGKYKLEEHRDRADFGEAYRILRECVR